MSKVLKTTRKWEGAKLAACLFAVCSAVSFASFGDALTLTWNGGAIGSLSDESWSGGAEGHTSPQNGDTLIFASGGTFANDIAGLSVAKLDFRSADAVTLTGNQIAVANGGSITNTGAGPVTFNVPLSLGTAATPAIRIGVAPDSTVNFNACISGAADIIYCDNGTVNLNVDNDYTGKTTINKGIVHVYANNAFGTTDGYTEIKYPSKEPAIMNHVYFHGITTSESFTNETKIQSQAICYPDGSTNIFNGEFIENSADLYSYGRNSRVVYNGRARFPNPSAQADNNTSVVEFNGEGSYFGYDYFGCPGVISYGAQCYVGDGSHYVKVYEDQKRYFNCENAMYYNNVPAFLYVNGNNGLADMCGYDQTFWYIYCPSDRSGTVITSAVPSTVHLTLGTNWTVSGNTPTTCYAKFRGPVSLSFEGPLPMTLGTASTATGAISLSNESDITLLSSFEWGGSSLTVSDGSSLTCNTIAFPPELVVAINDRAASEGVEAKASRIALGGNVMCSELVINGMTMQLGKSYGSSESEADEKDDTHFSGTGMLSVLASTPLTLTWAGGESGNFATGPWSGGAEGHTSPQNGDTLIFASGGTFENDIVGLSVAKLDFRSADAVTLTGGTIAIANGGSITTTGAGPVTFNAPLTLGVVEFPVVTIDVANECTNTFNTCISGAANIVYSNNGTVNLMVDNDYTGMTTINKGIVHVYANNAFGTTNGITKIIYPEEKPAILNHVYFHGITTDETFDNNMAKQESAVLFPAGTTNIFNGGYKDVSDDYIFGANAKVVFNGKVYLDNPSSRNIPYSTTIEFNGAGSQFGYEHQIGGVFWYNAQCTMLNSKGGYVGVGRGNQSRTFHFNCENALLYDATQPAYLDVVGSNGEVDLCGYDQTFRCIRCAPNFANNVSITSATPSTVHLTLEPIAGKLLAVTNYAKCYGAISLSCEGPMPMTLGTASTATGAISLSNASDVTLANGFGWNCTALNVADGSTLRVGGTVSLPNALPMAISDRVADGETAAKNSVVRLDANLTVDTLTVNGVVMPGGRTYGSSSSVAAVKDDAHFAGTGVLRVRHPCGMRIEIR